jgi:hypothetical protein
MLHTILSVAGVVLATITVATALIYVLSVRRVNRLYREMQFAEGETVRAKAQAYWSVETIRRRAALIGIVAYAIVLLGITMLGESKVGWHMFSVLAASVGALGLSITATINNMKQTEMRIEADVSRRYKRIV